MFRIFRIFCITFFIFASQILGVADLGNGIVCTDASGKAVYFNNSYNYYPQYKNEFVAYIKKHIANSAFDFYACQSLMGSYPETHTEICDAIIQRIKEISQDAIIKVEDNLYYYFSEEQKNKIKKAVQAKWPPVSIDISQLLQGDKGIILPKIKALIEYAKNKHKGTQTEHHVCKYLAQVVALLKQYKTTHQKPEVKKMLWDAFMCEVQEHNKGNYVFWHGRKYQWDFCEYVYRNIYNLTVEKKKQVADDYTFLRFDGSVSHFSGQGWYSGVGSVSDVLYMNAYLFGNSGQWDNSTIQLVLKNTDWSDNKYTSFTPEYILSQFKLKKYYEKYAADFTKLQELHQAANPHNIGNLLMLAIDQAHIGLVHTAGSYATDKRPVTLSNGQTTTEAKKIIDELRAGKLENSDTIEYVLQLTKDYALDPKKGLRIYNFNACDPKKRKEFENYGAALFAKIAADMAAEKTKWW